MDWDTLSKTIVGIGSAAVAVLAIIREWESRHGQRRRLKQDLEILNALPADSSARRALGEHVDDSVLALIHGEKEMRRDPAGIVLALVLLGGSVWTASLASDGPVGWWIAAAFLGMLGAVGLPRSFSRSITEPSSDDRARRSRSVCSAS